MDVSGSVDRRHNVPGSRLVEADAGRLCAEAESMKQPPYAMDESRRGVVLAAHVRTNHVHM